MPGYYSLVRRFLLLSAPVFWFARLAGAALVVTKGMRIRAATTRWRSSLPTGGAGNGTPDSPRTARDDAWAAAVMAAWREDTEIAACNARGETLRSETAVCQDDKLDLHGELYWTEGGSAPSTRPGVLLVHTAVGPRDLMLQWRAQCLAAQGYVAMIVDLFGDASGAAWEAEWAAPRRAPLVSDRELSRRRMRLAMARLCAGPAAAGAPSVDAARIGAVGYCFGGRSVLDLARGAPAGLVGVVSMHGILDAEPLAPGVEWIAAGVLLCHGDADPFVPAESVAACVAQLRAVGAGGWQLHTYGGAPHAFTNPAQALNERDGFGYDATAAAESWRATTAFLAQRCA